MDSQNRIGPREVLLAIMAAIVNAMQRDAAGEMDLDNPANGWALAESIIEDARRLYDDTCREP